MNAQQIITTSVQADNMELNFPSLAAEDRKQLIREHEQWNRDHKSSMDLMLNEIKRWHLQ